MFRSRFLDAAHEAAPLRAARRLREYLAGEVIHAVVQIGFLVALVFFGRALLHLFEKHGAQLNPWYLRVSLVAVGTCVLLIGRRLVVRLIDIRDTRRDLAEAQRQLSELRDANRGVRPERRE
ncbi:hypothetical protein GF314_09055 [bacterium]|nr:hypothetical protein [bacterium]